jgi:hypothetical protein
LDWAFTDTSFFVHPQQMETGMTEIGSSTKSMGLECSTTQPQDNAMKENGWKVWS